MAILNINTDIAEFLGILIGDGYLDKQRERIIISGNLLCDSKYLKSHVKKLIESLSMFLF
jgi:hypothetical protein